MKINIEKYYHKEMDNESGILHSYHRTKIIATVGPACDTYEKLLGLVKAGVNIFRLNFSFGNHQEKSKIINYIARINKTQPYNISIIADLQGPKLRVGEIKNGSMVLQVGEKLIFTTKKVIGTKESIYLTYSNLSRDTSIGETILAVSRLAG